jgi:hypothetical protein
MQSLYNQAHEAGEAAVSAAKVVPMVVGQAKNFFGNEIDYSQETYFIADGVCGFASINVKPANSEFGKYLKDMMFARRDSYNGGVSISVMGYGQSLQKKEAYAYAFAKVLNEAGIKAYVNSRMD